MSTKKSKKPTKARVKMPKPTRKIPKKEKDDKAWDRIVAILKAREQEKEVEINGGDRYVVDLGRCAFCDRQRQLFRVYDKTEEAVKLTALCYQCVNLMGSAEAAN